jgi:hypothetical protein
MPNEGDKKELNCARCQKATTHVFEIVGMVPEITLQWCCKVCGTAIVEKELKMKASPRTFLQYLYQYAGVSARESIRTSLKVIADAFKVPLWTAAKIMRLLDRSIDTIMSTVKTRLPKKHRRIDPSAGGRGQ